AATFCAASPRTQAAARGDSRGSGDSRPYLPRRRFRMRTHPTRYLNIVGAGGNKVTQRRRLETGGSEKPAIHRTIVMIGARPAEYFSTAFVNQPSRNGRERSSERCKRAAWSGLIQIKRKATQFVGRHHRVRAFAPTASCQRPPATPAARRPSRLGFCRFFHLIDVLVDLLHRRMQFFKNFVLFPGEFFDAARLLLQFFQHDVLLL